MNPNGKPRDPGSNLSKLRLFFENNPTEELTPQDIALKLDIPVKKTYTLIQKLKDAGLCESACVIRAVKQ